MGRTTRNWLGTIVAALVLTTAASSTAHAGFTSVQIARANESAIEHLLRPAEAVHPSPALTTEQAGNEVDAPDDSAATASKPLLIPFEAQDKVVQGSRCHIEGVVVQPRPAAIVVPLPPAVFSGSIVLAANFALALMLKKGIIRL
jgi:hypothetical protein